MTIKGAAIKARQQLARLANTLLCFASVVVQVICKKCNRAAAAGLARTKHAPWPRPPRPLHVLACIVLLLLPLLFFLELHICLPLCLAFLSFV